MPPLKGYESQATRSTPQGQSLQAPTTQLAQQQSNTLASRLDQFSSTMLRAHEAKVSDQAVNDALKDSAEGKPFHKEEVYTTYGRAYNNTLSATYAADAELQISEKSLELAMEHEHSPTAYSSAMDSFAKSLAENAPTPELSTVIGLSGQKTKNAMFGKLTVAENNRFKAKKVETFNQSWELVKNQIVELRAQGKHADADVLKDANLTYLDAMVAEGLIDESDKLRLVSDAVYDVTLGTDMRLMEQHLEKDSLQDASLFLQSKTEVNREDMDIPQNEMYKDALNKMFNNEIKSRKAQASGNKEHANLVLGKVTDILEVGKIPPIDLFNEARAISSSASESKQDKFNTMFQAYNIIKKFDGRSLPEQEAELARREQDPYGTSVSIEVLRQVKKNLSRRKSAAKKDPIAQSVAEGRGNIKPINVTNGILALSQELPNRVSIQQGNILEYGKNATQLFTDSEASEWSAYLESATTSIEEKLSFIDTINSSAPNNVNSVFNQLRKKGASVFSYAASMAYEGKREVARGILQGQTILKEVGNQEYVKKFKTELLSDMGNAMIFAGQGDRESLVDASLAYSLFLAEQRGDVTDLKGSSESQAMNDLTNGLHKRNGQDFFLPSSVSRDDFDSWVEDELSEIDFDGVAGIEPHQALSLVQSEESKIVSIGSGEYMILDMNNNRLRKSDGSLFKLRY